MVPAAKKLWNRDFSLLVFGQIMSLFGNMVLSFALPLYILDISGSPALFGLVMSLPYISLVIMSPIGGIIADRLKKQRIMFWLDVSTTIIIVLYIAASGFFTAIVPIVIVKLMALNAIQGLYMPAVHSSVPLLVSADKLVPANAVTSSVNMFSNMAGMAIAGVVYASFGLFPILAVSAVCFAITAVMDLLIRIPYNKQENPENIGEMVKRDMYASSKFMVKEKPIIAKSAVIIFFMQASVASMLTVGVSVLISQNLGLGMELVGISQSIMMAGGLFGGIMAGTLGARLTMKKAPLLLLFASVAITPIALPFLFSMPAFLGFIIITAASFLTVSVIQMAQVQFFAFIQGETPNELIGKVVSLIAVLPFIASALGMFTYGVLFEQFYTLPWITVFATVFVSGMVALYSRRLYAKALR